MIRIKKTLQNNGAPVQNHIKRTQNIKTCHKPIQLIQNNGCVTKPHENPSPRDPINEQKKQMQFN